MDKEKIIEILEDYEFFVDDDFGGHYEHIDCSQRARIPLGILEILDYISNLEQQCKQQKEVIDKANEVIDKMINIGYSSGFTQYCATGEDSEFGTRAKIIKDILKGVSE